MAVNGLSAPRGNGAPASVRDSGFTLIEILVVLVIMAVLATAVTLAIGAAGGERQVLREGERLRALIEHACTQAELGGREIGIQLGPGGYRFLRLGFDGWSDAGATPEWRAREWVTGLQLELFRDRRPLRLDEDIAAAPQIVCFSSGELSPFVLRLHLGDSALAYELSGELDGSLRLERLERGP